jgi:hypothetical protein
MNRKLRSCASSDNLVRVKKLVEGGADMESTNSIGMTARMLASLDGKLEVVAYLVEYGANVAHTDSAGMTALLHSVDGNLPTVQHLLEHGASITERSDNGTTALLHAAKNGRLEVVQFLLSPKGGASITETDNKGNTALLLAGGRCCYCYPSVVQWLLEFGGAQITDKCHGGKSVWTAHRFNCLLELLISAYTKDCDGEYFTVNGKNVPNGNIVALTAMLRVIVLHGGPPKSLLVNLAPPLQRIIQDGARLQARLPAYLRQRRALLDAYCPLLPPLQALVHGYGEPTTTDELWATGLGAPTSCKVSSNNKRIGMGMERDSIGHDDLWTLLHLSSAGRRFVIRMNAPCALVERSTLLIEEVLHGCT